MRAGKRIRILRRPGDAFGYPNYLIHLLIEEWRRRGIPVDVTSRLSQPTGKDVVVLPHFDETRTPPAYEDLFARCPVVLNRRVTDISKRRVSGNLVTRPGEFDGPVIVKTDRNAGGEPEKAGLRRRGRLAAAALDAARRLPWAVTGLLGANEYPVYDHPRLVPWAVWHNPLLVVERFLPERHDGQYALRQYVFLGSCEINVMLFADVPLVKARNIVRREVLPDTPPEMRRIRAALGFDYGKFDYVMRDGRAVLFDANRTPTYNPASKAGSPNQLLLGLAQGIDAFIGGSS